MRSRSSIALLAALAVLALDGVARADVPPPEDYVDPCKSAALDESCQRCVSPEFKNPDCHAKAREGGLVQRCQGWSYTMYCREGGAAEAAKPVAAPAAEPAAEPVKPTEAAEAVKPTEAPAATPPSASCAVAGSGSGSGSGWALGWLLLVAAARVRRGRGRSR